MERYTILPKSNPRPLSAEVAKKTAVIAHLYYEDHFDASLSYLLNVPSEIEVYIITAKPALFELAQKTVRERNIPNMKVLSKPNRGRDFGALLIAAKPIWETHEYLCFVHDKKSHEGQEASMATIWEKCLFENTLGSKAFVESVVSSFEENPDLGILSVPTPTHGAFLELAGGAYWTDNYDQTLLLLQKLGVSYVPSEDEDPLTIGGAFWFRAKALEKLFAYPWAYEDFPEEPMPPDFCIAHRLERVPEAVCLDAGYTGGYAVNVTYADSYFSWMCDQLSSAVSVMREAKLFRFGDLYFEVSKVLEKIRCRRHPFEYLVLNRKKKLPRPNYRAFYRAEKRKNKRRKKETKREKA